MGHYFVTWGFFSWEVFLHLGLYFVTLFQKLLSNKNICFHNQFFVLKTTFLTSHKLIFSFLVPFQRFQAFFNEVQQILVKYRLFMYLWDYQRFYQLFFKGFSKKCYIMVICIQKVYSCWQMLFQLLYMVVKAHFWKKIFLNLQILCNFSSICHCTHPINPCKVSFFSYGFREFSHQRNNDHINILSWKSSL